MPKVGQHGCPGAPQASHALATQTVSVVVHADPGPTHLFVAGSQHAVDAHAGPPVQHGNPSVPHVGVGDVAPEQLW
jgi:hypothetical protein